MIYVLFVLLWILCGYVAHGFAVGDLTREFPDQKHEPFCYIWSYAGGAFAIVALCVQRLLGGMASFVWRPKALSKKERWEAFSKMYPYLARDYTVDTFDKRF